MPQIRSDNDETSTPDPDELHLAYPFAGSRMLRDLLRGEGIAIGRELVATPCTGIQSQGGAGRHQGTRGGRTADGSQRRYPAEDHELCGGHRIFRRGACRR